MRIIIYSKRSDVMLMHHGIKGMRWGVRRFQKKDGSLTSAGKKRYDDSDESNKNKKAKASKRKGLTPGQKKAEASKKKGLTSGQKKAIIIGASAVATGLAIYGGYKLSKMYKGSDMAIDPETGFRLLNKDSDRGSLSKVNPGRIRFGLSSFKNKEIIGGSSSNCMLCTTAYEMRQRGFDVKAGLDKDLKGYLPDDLFPKLFKNYSGTTKLPVPWKTSAEKLKDIEDFVKNSGPGSRGNIMMWYSEHIGGGHSMIWENIDGKVIFKDGQTGQVCKDFAKEMLAYSSNVKPIEMLRTDNLIPNISEMKSYLNTDTTLKTYVKHGGEIARSVAEEPVVQAGIVAGAYGALYGIDRKYAIKEYKNQHPNTKLSDKEIARMLARQ